MPPAPWIANLAASPELFPLTLDAGTDLVRVVRLAPVDYEKASFLDERIEAPTAGEAAFADLAQAVAGRPIACDWIFHVGHVGSTLMSRLLGTHPRIFSVREPQVLRTLAAAESAGRPWSAAELDARMAAFQAIFSRVWAPPKRALVKATSVVSGLAPRLLAQAPDDRALAMTTAPETYLATIFSGANLADVRLSAPLRLTGLNARLGAAPWALEDLSPGEIAALSWAADMLAFAELEAAAPGRVLRVDFEAFLADPPAGLAQALTHLHGQAEPEAVARIAGSAYLQRYSKAPEYGYSPELRAQVLAETRRLAAEEIARGLGWLETAARTWPAIAQLVG
ncbi:MAG: hypothetical protein E7812_03155 [Phenylobacterium sp.]|nr:MAG: hypothetical protein E7812_03155 [Phenylobacterium sp.]